MPNYDEPKILNLGDLLKQAEAETRRRQLLVPLEEVAELRAQLAAATAQRDELLRAAVRVSEESYPSPDADAAMRALRDAIARAQFGQPASGGGAS